MQRLRTIVLAVLMLMVGVVTPAAAVTNPTIAAWAPISVTYGTAPIAITPPASNSPGGWTYATGSSGVAVVSGNVLTFTGIGTTTLYGTQAASGDFAAATAMTTITVKGVAPTLGPWPDFSIAYGSIGSATLVPPSSNSTGAWTYTSSNPAVASVSGNVITLNAVGSTVITAVQTASGAYLAATATRTLTVAGSSPSVGSWPALTVALKPFASNAFTLTPPSSNSPGAWSYTSSDTSTVSITGSVATPLKPGSATITAVQAAAGGYGTSAPVTTTISVTAAMPTLGAWPALTKASTDPDFTLTPPTSPSAGTWSYVSSDTAVATVAGNTVHIVGPGSATITATQAANWMWAQAQVSATLTVSGTATGGSTGSTQSGGTTTGTPGAHAPMAIGVGDTVAIADLIPGIWSYTSSNSAVATVLGTTLTGMKAGTVTISGVLAGSTVYTKANPLTFTAKVQTRATVGNFANITVKVGAKARAITAPASTSPGAWTYSSSAPTVASISGGTLTFHAAGKTTITAVQAATATFAATRRVFTVTVNGTGTSDAATAGLGTVTPLPASKGTKPKLGTVRAMIVHVGAAAARIPVPTSTSKGAWTFALAKKSIGTIAAGRLTVTHAAITEIIATQKASGKFAAVKVRIPVTALPKVTALLIGRTLTITVQGGAAKMTLDGKTVKPGSITVKPGTHPFRAKYQGILVYTHDFHVA